jgi:uncharacterized protein YkwD
MISLKRLGPITFLGVLSLLIGTVSLFGQQPLLQRSNVTEIEDQLLKLINQSRAQHNLEPLDSSSYLRAIARAHSQDMASGGSLSHISTTGETYTERLATEDVLFGHHGENVAFSQTFVPEIIHQSLMDSPEHRKNILKPEFEIIGIGVFFQTDKGYYITQDFIRPLTIETELSQKDKPGKTTFLLEEHTMQAHLLQVKQRAKQSFGQIRFSRKLPEFDFIPEADNLADRYSRSKAEARRLPELPAKYKVVPVLFVFITAPSLENALPDIQEIEHAQYHSGGLGVSFGRNGDHPGGAYFFTFLLIKGSRHHSLKPSDWKNIWMDHVNRERQKGDLEPVMEIPPLSRNAEEISRQAQKRHPITLSTSLAPYTVRSYFTTDLTLIPQELQKTLTTSRKLALGLGISYQPDPELPTGSFTITVIYR